jgi:hypothetical protein
MVRFFRIIREYSSFFFLIDSIFLENFSILGDLNVALSHNFSLSDICLHSNYICVGIKRFIIFTLENESRLNASTQKMFQLFSSLVLFGHFFLQKLNLDHLFYIDSKQIEYLS